MNPKPQTAAVAAPLEVVEPAGCVGDEALRAGRAQPPVLHQAREPAVNNDAALAPVVACGDDAVVEGGRGRALKWKVGLANVGGV